MDVIGLISSVSRLAIAAFVITLVVVGYEVFLISRRKKQQPIVQPSDVSIPEFSADARPGTFSPIQVDEAAKESFQLGSRKIPRSYAYVLAGLCVLLLVGGGFLIYKRSTLTSPDVKLTDVAPTKSVQNQDGQSTDLLTGSPDSRTQASISPTGILTPSQTNNEESIPVTLAPTADPTVTPTGPVVVPSDIQSNNSISATPTPTSMAEKGTTHTTSAATPAPTTQNLPQAGTYQHMLVLSLVSVAVIYLALIL